MPLIVDVSIISNEKIISHHLKIILFASSLLLLYDAALILWSLINSCINMNHVMNNNTQEIPNLDQLFVDLEESIEFSADQILTQETRDSLTSFSNAGLESIDYAQYMTQITSNISTLAVDRTISTLEEVQNGFIRLSLVSITILLQCICYIAMLLNAALIQCVSYH